MEIGDVFVVIVVVVFVVAVLVPAVVVAAAVVVVVVVVVVAAAALVDASIDPRATSRRPSPLALFCSSRQILHTALLILRARSAPSLLSLSHFSQSPVRSQLLEYLLLLMKRVSNKNE